MKNNYDLSVLIPARNEMFISKTVENILQNIRGKTEIIVALDGAWADPGIAQDPRVTLIYFPEAIGQRAATNQAARLSKAKYVMKIDAHCVVDEGFDLKMMMDMKDNYTMIPTLYNLHGFDWICIGNCPRSGKPYIEQKDARAVGCGWSVYQSPTPKEGKCPECGGGVERQLIFKPRFNRRSFYYRFDKNLHFQYWGSYEDRPIAQGDIVDIMSAQGSCFMLTREKYWELNMCDENHGSWGQQGVEIACKTWLSGGRLVTTKKTWYSHMFRTQGGDFGFPYPLSGSDVDKARKYSKELWIGNTWPKAIHSFEWLLEKFAPVPDWHDEEHYNADKNQHHNVDINKMISKGIIFYTDNKVNLKIAHAVQKQLRKTGLPIVSTSLKPMPNFGQNIHIKLVRGYLTMFKQILAALEASKSDIIFHCEHDVLYHPSHFDFTPPRKDMFYYNVNVWKVNATTGHGVKVDIAQQVSGLCAYRELLIEEYRNRVKRVEEAGEFKRGWGFEPGTKSIKRGGFSDLICENWTSQFPNIDIRADHNVTASRWTPEEFRNKVHTIGWTESDEFPGWPMKKYFDILSSI